MAELKKDKAPLFYQLTNKEWVETVKDLTGVEIKVLYYVRSSDPFGDREGQVEVTTAVGRIDLLTESEVIEIKEISDWKEALGKILAYSAFFPNHSKRIHLFGFQDLSKLALAQAACSGFGITVTFEEVR